MGEKQLLAVDGEENVRDSDSPRLFEADETEKQPRARKKWGQARNKGDMKSAQLEVDESDEEFNSGRHSFAGSNDNTKEQDAGKDDDPILRLLRENPGLRKSLQG